MNNIQTTLNSAAESLKSFGERVIQNGFKALVISGIALLCIKHFGTKIVASTLALAALRVTLPTLVQKETITIKSLLSEAPTPTPTPTPTPAPAPAPTPRQDSQLYEKKIVCSDGGVYTVAIYGAPGLTEEEQDVLILHFTENILRLSVPHTDLKKGDKLDFTLDPTGVCSSTHPKTKPVLTDIPRLDNLKKITST